MHRRRVLKALLGLGLAAPLLRSSSAFAHEGSLNLLDVFDQGLVNACGKPLPKTAEVQYALAELWHGLDPTQMWDSHVHLIGVGDHASGIYNSPDMDSWLHPMERMRKWFYMHAACGNVQPDRSVDEQVVGHLLVLMRDYPVGAKCMLFAFDACHSESGDAQKDHTAFYVPNTYAAKIAHAHSDRFEWVASVHPYRKDAIEALNQAVKEGARAVKWLPAAMGIDPQHPQCHAFYEAMVKHNLPLISHAGQEKAVHGANRQDFNNPLKLREALEAGVRVIVAHCASLGEDLDLDAGKSAALLPSFKLFERLMSESHYEGRLFGDISAITQANRSPEVLQTILSKEDWHHRLLNGSDYPLPAVMPFFAPKRWVKAGMLDAKYLPVLHAVREANPLLFDLMLKRQLSWKGHRLAASVFHTRAVFDRHA